MSAITKKKQDEFDKTVGRLLITGRPNGSLNGFESSKMVHC